MKIHIPAYEPSLECTERLRHGEIDIDLGEDVVRVVFCKDCKYCSKVKDLILPITHSICCYRPNNCAVEPNDFCSYGERKDKI